MMKDKIKDLKFIVNRYLKQNQPAKVAKFQRLLEEEYRKKKIKDKDEQAKKDQADKKTD